MKPIPPIWIAAAVLTATLALTGCKNRKEEPIPGPKATWSTAATQTPSPNAPRKGTRPARGSRPPRRERNLLVPGHPGRGVLLDLPLRLDVPAVRRRRPRALPVTRKPPRLLQSASPYGPVAQRLVQGTHNPLVVGSNPTGPNHLRW